jgi:putative ABC transport system permease protein
MFEAIRNNSLVRSLGKENILFAFRAIITQKLRSFLTLLGIVAGVATVIAMVSFVAGFNEAITGAFSSFGTTLVQFQKYDQRFGGGPGPIPEEQRKRRDLTLEDADALKRLATLAGSVSPERYTQAGTGSATVKNRQGAEANGPTIAGVVPDYLKANNSDLSDGRFFTESDILHGASACVIGEDIVKALFPGRDPMGQEVLLHGVPLQVVGVLESKGSELGGSADNIVLIPISVFDSLFPEVKNGHGDSLHIATTPRDPTQVQELLDQGVSILRQRRGLKAHQPNDFASYTAEENLETFRQVTGGIAAAMIFIAGIALLVGGVGIMNIMLVSVTERTREIGVRKAMGATRKDIAAQFLVEAVTLTTLGGVIGIALGFAVAFLVRFVFDFPAAAPLWSVILGFGISSAIGLTFGLWPAVKAAKQDPIEALRYE